MAGAHSTSADGLGAHRRRHAAHGAWLRRLLGRPGRAHGYIPQVPATSLTETTRSLGRRLVRRPSAGTSRRGRDHAPLLSVVVPVHDVEPYLGECLESLVAQTYANTEFLLVDDGSTDGSAAIIDSYADRDERFVVLRQPHGGPGAARNNAVAQASGDYLAFLDSDDTVPPQAYAQMVQTLRATGSDFVVGSVAKQAHGRLRVPPWIAALHRQQRLRLTIDDAPEIITNIFVWNKVVRRSFWQAHGLRFPEGVRYEDHVPLTRAFLVARSFDVLPDVVYRWRQRENRSSITQRKHEIGNLADFLVAKQGVTDLVTTDASPVVRRLWFTRLFNDFRPYIGRVPHASDEYWNLLQEGARQFVDLVPGEAFDDVPARTRLLCWLVANNRRTQVETVVAYLGEHPEPDVVARDGASLFAFPYLDEPAADVPSRLYRLSGPDRRLNARLDDLAWVGRSSLQIAGAVSVTGSAAADVCSVSVVLRERHSSRCLVMAGEHHAAPAGDADGLNVSFRASVDWTALTGTAGPIGGHAERPWGVDLLVTTDDHRVEGPLTRRTPGVLRRPSSPPGAGESGVHARWLAGVGLELVVR